MADEETRNENDDTDANAPEQQPGTEPSEEPAGKEAEDQPEEVQGDETVVEDEETREREASPESGAEAGESPEADAGAEPAEPAEPRRSQQRDSKAKSETKPETVPGAELEPIAIEPERELSAEERARLEAEAEERARLEAEATADEAEEPGVRRQAAVAIPADSRIQATGKRKSSIARVIISAGGGSFHVNERELDEYFPRPYLRTVARQPLVTAGYEDSVDVRVRVHGGGISGQAGAVRHGIARALCEIDPELRGELKRRGLLTRDARAKERRKAGLKKARKRPQFSKR